MKDYHQLIDDMQAPVNIATKLLAQGYYPVPCGAGEDGKGWINASSQGSNVSVTRPGADGSAPPKNVVLDLFHEHPSSGVSVAVPHLRDPEFGFLLAIDVDVSNDQALLDWVALIIGSPCPVKVGARGATFFVRSKKVWAVNKLLQDREIPIPLMPGKDGKSVKSVQSGKIGCERWGDEYIDVLGTANRHSLLPPTFHIEKQVYYRWVEFPGSNLTLKLEDTPPAQLPVIGEPHLLLLFQLAKNPDSPIWQYLGQTSKGNHHQLMLDASLYMWHERFTQEEIVYICETEAWRSCEDERHYEDRRQAIKNSVQNLASKFPEQKPAKTKRPRGGSGDKVPMDRVAADWLRTEYLREDLGAFNGIPHWWNQDHWECLIEHNRRQPSQLLREKVQTHFSDIGRQSTSSAVEDFLDGCPVRIAAPDPRMVPFANGLLDVLTGEQRQETREDCILERLPCEYDPDATCPAYDDFITKLMTLPLEYQSDDYTGDHQRAIDTLEEFLGLCLVLSHEFRSMLFLVGHTSTGKSELMKLVKALMPRSWVSDVAMSLLDDDNAIMGMVNAHLNISGEIGRHNKDVDTALLKITSGEPIPMKILFKDRFDGVVAARLMFHGNLPPDTTDSTGAIAKRMILLRTTDIEPEVKITDYHRLLVASDAKGILNRWVSAYARLRKRGKFDPPAYSFEAVTAATRDANSVSAWINEMTVPSPGRGELSSDLFQNYRDWCEAGKMFVYSVVQWGKLMTASGFPSRVVRGPSGIAMRYRNIRLINAGPSY